MSSSDRQTNCWPPERPLPLHRLKSPAFWRQLGMHPARLAIGAGIALALTGLATAWLLPEATALPFLVAPMGASAVLVFALPAAPLA